MADFVAVVASLREQMQANLSRSDVLKALILPISICVLGIMGTIAGKGPAWVLVLFSVFLTLCFGVYLFSYLFCLFRDRDALRSEKYNMSKLAIEHGLLGDSNTGIIDMPTSDRALPSSKLIEDEK